MTFSQAWWEDQGESGLREGKDFNATVFIFVMKNRFHEDYKDKHEIEHDARHSFEGVWRAIAERGQAEEEALRKLREAAAEGGKGASFADVVQAIGDTGKAAAMAAASEDEGESE
jgi:hypothetical protein